MSIWIGIDWSEQKHQVVVLNSAGAVIAQLVIPHSVEGFQRLDQTRQALGVEARDCPVALETAHNLLIDFLWDQGYSQVYVVPPRLTSSCRGRYRQSGAHNDFSDAYLLANLLRTDSQRLYPWKPDAPETRQMRALVSRTLFLTRSNGRLMNRLRAVLLRFYPAALEVFSTLDGVVTLEFLRAFPGPQTVTGLTLEGFVAFAREHGYSRPRYLGAAFARLKAPQPSAAPEIEAVYQQEVGVLATLLLAGVRARQEALRSLRALFEAHPDREVFGSLPGAGEFLAPGLLVKFGDDRARFPTPGSVQALAGSCPVTEESGKKRWVRFRTSCDREFRYISHQWAWHTLEASVWANTYYQRVLEAGHSENHALRCLVNRWLAIVWRLWQDRVPYDEAYHLQRVAERQKPRR